MLWDSIFDFYINNIFGGIPQAGTPVLSYLTWNNGARVYLYSRTIDFLGVNIPLPNYLAFICTLITIIFILVLCCLFIYKIIKLVGGLIR